MLELSNFFICTKKKRPILAKIRANQVTSTHMQFINTTCMYVRTYVMYNVQANSSSDKCLSTKVCVHICSLHVYILLMLVQLHIFVHISKLTGFGGTAGKAGKEPLRSGGGGAGGRTFLLLGGGKVGGLSNERERTMKRRKSVRKKTWHLITDKRTDNDTGQKPVILWCGSVKKRW